MGEININRGDLIIASLPHSAEYAQRVANNLVKASVECFTTIQGRAMGGLPERVLERGYNLEELYAYGYLDKRLRAEYELYRQLERQDFKLAPVPIDYRLFDDQENNIRVLKSIRQSDVFLIEQLHDRTVNEDLETLVSDDSLCHNSHLL